MSHSLDKKRLRTGLRVCAAVLLIYIAMILLFRWLAGDQLLYRDSRGDLELPAAESGTVELVAGIVLEQTFTAEIERLESVSLQWGAYYRANAGTVDMELVDARDQRILMHGAFDAAAIQEGQILTIASEEPLEGLYRVPVILRVSADSAPGSAVTPLMTSAETEDSFSLSGNGTPWTGMLCFSAQGQDYIWTGVHYWLFAGAGAALLTLFLGGVLLRYAAGRRSYVVGAMQAVHNYRFLIQQLVSRDFKTKYKRSILGVFWSFLNPLLTMLVLYFVFSNVFRFDIAHYPVYLLIGIVSFNFFNEACSMSLSSIIGNAGLITKVYMPKYIYPLTRTISSGINLLISLIPLILIGWGNGIGFYRATILALYFLGCLVVFSLGLGILLSAAMVFFLYVQYLWSVFSTMWMYATPIFYPESILPEQFQFVLTINPLYYFLKSMRMCILDGVSPEPRMYALCFVISLGMLCAGAFVFRKTQDKFILYL